MLCFACILLPCLFLFQVQAAFSAGAILIFGGWVDAKKTVGYVDWSLLLLIGSALGLSKGIVNSGLAGYVGGAIRDSGISAEGSLFVLYAFTMVSRPLRTAVLGRFFASLRAAGSVGGMAEPVGGDRYRYAVM